MSNGADVGYSKSLIEPQISRLKTKIFQNAIPVIIGGTTGIMMPQVTITVTS